MQRHGVQAGQDDNDAEPAKQKAGQHKLLAAEKWLEFAAFKQPYQWPAYQDQQERLSDGNNGIQNRPPF